MCGEPTHTDVRRAQGRAGLAPVQGGEAVLRQDVEGGGDVAGGARHKQLVVCSTGPHKQEQEGFLQSWQKPAVLSSWGERGAGAVCLGDAQLYVQSTVAWTTLRATTESTMPLYTNTWPGVAPNKSYDRQPE